MSDRGAENMFNFDWIKRQLGLNAIARDIEVIKGRSLAMQESMLQVGTAIAELRNQIRNLEKRFMALPEVVLSGIRTEIEEGGKLQTLIAELKAKNAELETKLAGRPELGVDDIIVNQKELLAEIEKINPTPVSDAIVTEVKENPEIETPPVVDAAPMPTPEVVPMTETVEAAVEAIAEADAE